MRRIKWNSLPVSLHVVAMVSFSCVRKGGYLLGWLGLKAEGGGKEAEGGLPSVFPSLPCLEKSDDDASPELLWVQLYVMSSEGNC